MDHVASTDAELRRNGLGDMAVLHDYLISYITFLLDLEDVVRLFCCSRLLRVFACEEPLWLGLCLKQQDGVVQYKVRGHAPDLPEAEPRDRRRYRHLRIGDATLSIRADDLPYTHFPPTQHFPSYDCHA